MPGRPSLLGRALLAVVLTIGFYGLALGMIGGLLFISYASTRHGNRVPAKLVGACVIGAGIIAWSIFPRRDRFEAPGPLLSPQDHPRLFKELRSIADSVGQEMPVEVYAVAEINAWVVERGGFMGAGARRCMGLGLPLLRVLTVSQMRAVLVHEFGHFHGGDTKLGPWIGRTRGAIVRTIENLGSQGSILHLPFLWYGKMFLRVTHAISRRQEYAADELAASTVGAAPLASGLRAVHGMSEAYVPYLESEIGPLMDLGYRPPLAEGFARFLKAAEVSRIVLKSVDKEIESAEQNPYDTHPPLRDRLAALQDLPSGEVPANDPSALSLMGDVDSLEAQLLSMMVRTVNVRRLQLISWDEIATDEGAARVYLPGWEKHCRECGAGLAGVTPATIPDLIRQLSQFGRSLTKKKLANDEEGLNLAATTLGCAMTILVRRRGGKLEVEPGLPIRMRVGAETFEPFNVVRGFLSRELTAEAWRKRCAELGISDIDLGEASR